MPSSSWRQARRCALRIVLAGIGSLLLPACAEERRPHDAVMSASEPSASSASSASGAVFRDGRYRDNDIDFEPRGLADLLRWRWNALRDGLPKPPQTPTPRVAPDLAFLHANARAGAAMQPSYTWIGHASGLAQLGGINVLLDPIFSERASPFSFIGPKRAQPPGLTAAELPHIDAMLISHNHYDHCDVDSLRALNAQAGGPPLFIVPLGLKEWLASIDISHAVELDWWQSQRVGAVEIVLTPAQHWSGRGLLDRMQTLWGGYALFAPDFHLFFAGDTGYSRDFSRAHAQFAPRQQQGGGFDLALLPIGAYEPRWFMAQQHVNPAEAVQMHLDLQARQSVGIHWGTFQLTDEALDEPPQALARARRERNLADAAFSVLAVGQTLQLPRRATP